MLAKLEKWAEPVVIVTALAVVILLVFADVVARFAFSTSIAWAGEVARLAFVYMIYFGVSYAIRDRRHMRVTVLVDMAPPRLRRWLLLLAEAVFLVYSLAVCWLGVVITQNAAARGKILSATEWPTAVLYGVIAVTGALSVLRLCQQIWRIAVTGDAQLSPQMDV
ncbi:TRAP transporter small permease [Salipiger marinus]|jgi:TRAP-type transport system small permease protein|uniref:TRAP transporter small permease protein n=1 Tax=Salipiger marinus TaxID=555512 RepID=A0A1G8PB44_9RHOB|nr:MULTISPECIES: TRAP transporter small permease [Salipiger]HBM60924.1 TRAP transporter small permease [Citreicella sp.]MCD1618942.1 TRAP transporter small permease [Salipiger manganoxidans]MEB3419851.1 TRAP transporter small permease [Salipiger manganoxidans]SDI89617.1 TRAP-type C4-dicarboxylate transport system, small permease component [Salipiger marinus]HBT02102.1 TRAP transporter small permease [Citreicella sp.]